MTDREDAIILLECSANELAETLENTTVESAVLLLQRYIDAYNMGTAALRDQVMAKHGRWMRKGQDIFCSNCDYESGYNAFGASAFSNYCPNCGAKMDLEE